MRTAEQIPEEKAGSLRDSSFLAVLERGPTTRVDCRGAILYGPGCVKALASLRRHVPAVRHALVLVSDPDSPSARSLRDKSNLNPQGPEVTVGHASPVQTDYNAAAYADIVRWMSGNQLCIKNILVYSTGMDRPGNFVDVGTKAAVEDMLTGLSAHFLALLHDQPVPTQLYSQLGSYLARTGHPFHALKFLEPMRHTGRASPELAELAISCWLEVECMQAALPWLPYRNVDVSQGRATTFLREMAQEHGRRVRVRREKNFVAIRRFHPGLLAILWAYDSLTPGLVALTDELPCQPVLDIQRDARYRRLPILFELRDGQIHTLNSLPAGFLGGEPRGKLSSVGDSVLIGTVRPFDALLAVLENPGTYGVPNKQRPVFVLETDVAAFYTLLGAFDLSQHFADPSIRWFIGPKAEVELTAFLDSDPMRLIPKLCLRTKPRVMRALKDVDRRRTSEWESCVSMLAQIYDRRYESDLPHLLQGSGERKLRILMYTSLFTAVEQYCCAELQAAFQSLGVECMIKKESEGTERLSVLSVVQAVVEFRPDVLVQINHLRPQLPFPLPKSVPYICWIQDELPNLRDPQYVRDLGERDYTYSAFPEMLSDWRKRGYPWVCALPAFANCDKYQPQNDLGEPRNEVSFVCNIGAPRAEPSDATGLYGWLTRAFEQHGMPFGRTDRWSLLREWVESASEELQLELSSERITEIVDKLPAGLARQFHRLQTVRWLTSAGIPVALYGDGWGNYDDLRRYWRGSVAPGKGLARVYQESKVTLHVTENLNLHPRIFECLCSGGFVVARSCPSDLEAGCLNDQLEIGKSLAVFSSREELVAIVQRAFTDESWRRDLADSGRVRTLADHTHIACAKRILENLCNEIPVPGKDG